MGEMVHEQHVGCSQTSGRPRCPGCAVLPPTTLAFPGYVALSSEFTGDSHLQVGSLKPSPSTYRTGIRKEVKASCISVLSEAGMTGSFLQWLLLGSLHL